MLANWITSRRWTRKGTRAFWCALTFAAIPTLCPLLAYAEGGPEPNVANADELFRAGKNKLAEGDDEAACSLFEQSLRLDPAGGTWLNMAICHEKLGKTASAWRDLHEAKSAAIEAGRPDAVMEIEKRLTALAPNLSWVSVVVPVEIAEIPGVEVHRGAELVSRSQWGRQAPADPGRYVYRVSAPGWTDWLGDVEVPSGGAHQDVLMGRPTLEEAVAPPPRGPAPGAAPMLPASPQVLSDAPSGTPRSERSSTPMMVSGIVLTAIGALSVAGGALVFASGGDKGAPIYCYDGRVCGASQDTSGTTAGGVALAIGGALTLVGVPLWFFGARSDRSATPDGPGVALSVDGRGASLSGVF